MKSISLIFVSLLTSSGIAYPHHQHLQRHHMRKDVAWVTTYSYVTKTIDITTTICVREGFVPQTVSSSSWDDCNSKSFLGINTFSTSVLLPLTASACSLSSGDWHTTTDTTATSMHAALIEIPSSISSIVIDVTKYKSTSVYTPLEAITSSTPAPGATPLSISNECSSDSPCKGDITYYQAGLGACGFTNDGDIQNVVALPHGLMGTKSNGNPYCGKTVTITCLATGKTTTATVVDKCMGCDGFSIDLSNAAFLDLDDLAVGRTSASWYFN